MNQNISFACTGPVLFVRRVEVAVFAEAISVAHPWKFAWDFTYTNIGIKHIFLCINICDAET